MKAKNLLGKYLKTVYNKIYNDSDFEKEAKMRKEDFSRNRKVGFGDTILIILNKTKKGLNAAIRSFHETMQKESDIYSKQAFSTGRMKIKWEALRELFGTSVDEFYAKFNWKRYRGYRVCAIDGTKINLPYNEESIEEFGIQKSSGEVIQALGSTLYDVMNGVILDAIIAPYSSSERNLAKQHLEYLSEVKTENELIIFDRGYPSSELISFIESNKFKYLMRVDKVFGKSILTKTVGNDSIITHKFLKSKIEVKLRVIKVKIATENGKTIDEVLITNIFDEKFTIGDFAELYHLRWGIETKYNDIKNKIEIENFSGTSPLAIRQDFYATMFLSNLVAMMVAENEDKIKEIYNSTDNKYEYKININTVITLLKEKVIELFIVSSKSRGKKLLKYIYSEIERSVVPIRKNRSFIRNKKHKSSKYPQNQRA